MSQKLIEDAGLTSVSSLPFQTKAGKDSFLEILQTATLPNGIRNAQKRKQTITSLRTLPQTTQETWRKWFSEIATIETKLQEQLNSHSEILKDTIGQITFQHEWFKQLNYIPFVLICLAYFKIYLVPAMAILMPFLTLFLPFVYLRYSMKVPLSFGEYWNLLWKLWAGSSPEKGINVRSATQGLTFLFTIVQGIIQPIQNAKHCAHTNSYLLQTGEQVHALTQLYRNLEDSCSLHSISFSFPKDLTQTLSTDFRQLAVSFLENPLHVISLQKQIGKLESLFVLSCQEEFQPVSFLKPSAFPYLQITGFQDIRISKDKRVKSSILLSSTSHHSLLTGPNGGGKSSSLRAILQSVLFAQTFGYAAVESMTLRPFRWILSGLLLKDNPGKKSMFESEVRFAASLLRRKAGPGLVLFDELFHSTNPPDGIRTATCFLENIWKKPHIASVVSTHVFELVEKAPQSIQKLCVPGEKHENGNFTFTYKLQKGICRVSSVDRIWKQEGLVCKNCG
jgi:hypothetical protein